MSVMQKPLENIRVVDLTRILAGPYCTQMLGDFGAEIIKIERPGGGDDTRNWGPPFLKDAEGNDTTESAYYLCANRNKKSITIDITKPEGQELIHKLLENADILIENFKTGGLEKYGLGFDDVHQRHPHIIYTSITGFGHNGPLAYEPGYDFLAQAMGGLMACTGPEDMPPIKTGVALSDIMTGLNAAIGTLMALHARKTTQIGQHVDVSLLDSTLASMTNIAQYYLTSGEIPARYGNAHSTIVPYQAFEARDGYVILAIGNNSQFESFCRFIGHGEWSEDPEFATNSARVRHRDRLIPLIAQAIQSHTVDYWIEHMEQHNVPCGPVNRIDQSFEEPQAKARGMKIDMKHPLSDEPLSLVGNPIKMSQTPYTYDKHPPMCGEHTDNILESILGLEPEKIAELKTKNII